MFVTKQLPVAIDFHSIFFPYYVSQWLPSTVWLHSSVFITFSSFFQRFTEEVKLLENARV